MAQSSSNQWTGGNNQWRSGRHWEWDAERGWLWPWQGQQWSWSRGDGWAAAPTSAVADATNNSAAPTSAVADATNNAAASTPAVADATNNAIASPAAPQAQNQAEASQRQNDVVATSAVADATAAIADTDQNAVAPPPVPPGVIHQGPQVHASAMAVFDLNYFLNYRAFTDDYKQHNAALKYLRAQQEDTQNPFDSLVLALPHAGAVDVAVLLHAEKGMAWTFSDERRQWSWHELIAQLTDDGISQVVNGPQGHSGGVVGCSLALRPGSYDHKRHHMLRQTGNHADVPKLPIWDFVVHRGDGTAMRLRPQWSTRKVEIFEAEGHVNAIAPPRRGLGRSDGLGTYKYFKALGTSGSVRFDHTKKP